jgi:hypothetical protein
MAAAAATELDADEPIPLPTGIHLCNFKRSEKFAVVPLKSFTQI